MNWDIIGDALRLAVLGGLGVAGILAILIWKKNLATKVTFIRFVIQAVAFAAFILCFLLYFSLLYVLIAIFAITIVFRSILLRLALPLWLSHGLEVSAKKSL